MHAPVRVLALALLAPVAVAAQTAPPSPIAAPAAPARSIPARSIPARSVAARALPAAIVLDVNGDGVSLSGRARTSLLTGGPQNAKWTTAGSDDAFLLVDATSLRASTGISIANSSGEPLEGHQLFRDGLRVRLPGESPARSGGVIRDGWEMLGVLDADGDGRISASDPAWASLRLFTDRNADGTIGRDELMGLADARIDGLDARLEPIKGDLSSRAAAVGSFTTADGSAREMSSTSMTP